MPSPACCGHIVARLVYLHTCSLPSSPTINIKLTKEANNQGECDYWRGDHRVLECAAAGTAWLLQFIEDLQQSRDFHKTCELILPNEAASIPEVLLQFLPQNLIEIVSCRFSTAAV